MQRRRVLSLMSGSAALGALTMTASGLSRLALGEAQQKEPGKPAIPASTSLPVFDVVSIRENRSGDPNIRLSLQPGHFIANNTTFKAIMMIVYDIKEDYIYGLPGWTDSVRYDIEAKVSDLDPAAAQKITLPQRKEMVKQFLAERFHLQIHIEKKQLPIYELIVANGGPKLTSSSAAPDQPPSDKPRQPLRYSPGEYKGDATKISNLVFSMSQLLHRTIVDKTDLDGSYDFDLKWHPEDDAGANINPEQPGLFTAMQEQLGLKLQGAKGPVDTLVVDHVERPTEN